MRFNNLAVLLCVSVLFCTGGVSAASMFANFSETTSVIVNSTYVITDAPGTPMFMWIAAIIGTIILILISFLQFRHGEEGLVAVAAVFGSSFSFATAWNVDQITTSGIVLNGDTYAIIEKHTIYHFDTIALFILLPLLLFTLANVARIWLNYRRMKQIAVIETETQETE